MVMQVAALLAPIGATKKISKKNTPKVMEKKMKEQKICALLKGRVNGNEKNNSKNRR